MPRRSLRVSVSSKQAFTRIQQTHKLPKEISPKTGRNMVPLLNEMLKSSIKIAQTTREAFKKTSEAAIGALKANNKALKKSSVFFDNISQTFMKNTNLLNAMKEDIDNMRKEFDKMHVNRKIYKLEMFKEALKTIILICLASDLIYLTAYIFMPESRYFKCLFSFCTKNYVISNQYRCE